ncbi:FxsA family protein [Bacillus carboniphilus]|uniref:FxsA family protein n=1 Tax=Bacillus carboniphilus TaxID=86663 RepID=A0ABY9JXQ8_9BACI|nr:FxsA family protein [Bacillus carboniphilus]WLR44167.1 FxsA family protein [Bacillus carboniphilus]
MRWLVSFLIIVPAMEIGLLILSGKTLGVIPTVLLIIFTGIVGAYLAKKQGLETIRKVQGEMSMGLIPQDTILDGLCILVGGVVLLTPGFITDLMGFLLLFPTTRNMIKPGLVRIIRHFINNNRIKIFRL